MVDQSDEIWRRPIQLIMRFLKQLGRFPFEIARSELREYNLPATAVFRRRAMRISG